MNKDQRIYLRDILERIARIEHVKSDGEATFFASFMHQDTIIRNFEVIGEIVKRLDPSLTEQHSNVRWDDYAGFRDILIHQYDKVVLEIVWNSAQHDLEPLKAAVQALLEQLDTDAQNDEENKE
jgi:uncharacterized protein with HEPN domain